MTARIQLPPANNTADLKYVVFMFYANHLTRRPKYTEAEARFPSALVAKA